MKDDQVVRSVAAICSVALYATYLGLNGQGPIMSGVPGVERVHPFAFVLVALLVLALPEVLNMLPVGPTREKKD